MAEEAGPILVVDHDVAARALTRSFLAKAGFSTAEADTGEQALLVAQAAGARMAVVDVFLPGLSGYEVCHRLKAEVGAAFPVLLVSRAEREGVDSAAAFLLGADDCVPKPIHEDDLLAAVRRVLERTSEAA